MTNKRQNEIRALRSEAVALLRKWPFSEVEEAAWAFALDGWQTVPPLAAEFDQFTERFLTLVDSANLSDQGENAVFELLRISMDELRIRVQFIQTRAGDIRLSHQLRELMTASEARVSAILDRALASDDPAAVLLKHKPILDAFENAMVRAKEPPPLSMKEKAAKLAGVAVPLAVKYGPDLLSWLQRLAH